MRLARTMIRRTYRGSRAIVRWRKGRGAVDLRGSIFCEVRDRVEQPLCEFYASAIVVSCTCSASMSRSETEQCRATGAGGQCVMTVLVRSAQALVCAAVLCGWTAAAQTAPARQLVIPFENPLARRDCSG